jgi:hypothetical protein
MTRSDSEPARRPLHLYVVATVHLDTQWRWTVQDTIRDFLPATLEGNFAHFERYPFFVLSFEGAFRYMLIKEYYPEEFERLKGYIEKGRWAVAGSMLDSPDVNVVSPADGVATSFSPTALDFPGLCPRSPPTAVSRGSRPRSSATGWHRLGSHSRSVSGVAPMAGRFLPRFDPRAMARVSPRI